MQSNIQINFWLQSYWVQKFWNKIIHKGNKRFNLLLKNTIIKNFKLKNNLRSFDFLFLRLSEKYRIHITTFKFRKGKIIHQVPTPIRTYKSLKLFFKWIHFLIKKFINKKYKNKPLKVINIYWKLLKNFFYERKKKNLLIKEVALILNYLYNQRFYLDYRWKRYYIFIHELIL